MATVGTISRGIKAPIIKKGDDLAAIVADSLLAAAFDSRTGFDIQDRDVLAVTEAVVARAQGNYATVDQIAKDVRAKTGGGATTPRWIRSQRTSARRRAAARWDSSSPSFPATVSPCCSKASPRALTNSSSC